MSEQDRTADIEEDIAAAESKDAVMEEAAAEVSVPDAVEELAAEPAAEPAKESTAEPTKEPAPEAPSSEQSKEAGEAEALPAKPKFFIPALLLLAGIALILYAYHSAGANAINHENAAGQAQASVTQSATDQESTMVDGAADAAGQTTAAAGNAASDEAADEAAATVVPAVPTEKQFAWLAENADQFPAHKVELADGNAGLTDFLYRYGHGEDADSHPSPAGLTEEDLADTRMRRYRKDAVQIEVPYLRQWDERWGFYPYGSSVVGMTGCGPTCLSMAAAALTANTEDAEGAEATEAASPDVIAAFAEENGYYMDGTGTRWSLFTEGAKEFGICCKVIPALLESVQQEIDAGHPVILSMGPGNFTFTGHFILVTGYASDSLIIHDPNSEEMSRRLWKFDAIRPQIINLWTCMPLGNEE